VVVSAAAKVRVSLTRAGLERLALIAVAVAVLDGFSLFLARSAAHVDMLSPAEGVVLAMCLLARRSRPTLFAAAIGSVVGEVAVGAGVIDALLITSITYAGVALMFASIRYMIGGEIDFRSWRHLLKFLALGWLVSAAVAVPGSWLPLGDAAPASLQNWVSWSLSTALSYAIFTPTLVLLATFRGVPRQTDDAERRVLVANLAMLGLLLFVFSQSEFPAGFMVSVGLLGVAAYAEIEATSLALLFTSIVAIAATAMGHGPWLLVAGTTAVRVDAVEIFLAVLTTGIIPTAAAITERRRLQESLKIALDETRQAAAALREREELYRLLAENASDIVIRTDLGGRIQYVTPSIERILGYAPAELVGTRIYDLVLGEDVTRLKEAVDRAREGRDSRGQRIEYRARCRDGRTLWLESLPAIGRDSRGLIVGIVDTARDITERKAMEGALIDARERAEIAAAAKSEFLANMSHELKTPLTSVIGFADALNDYCDLDARARRFANGVRTASLALLSTVNDILDYSRLERGQLSYEPQFFRLRPLVQEALDMFAVQASEKGLALRLECASSLDEVEVFADPHRLRQVLLNLIGNAVKFTDKGAVTLRAACERTQSGEWRLRCEIIDTGPGIEPAEVGKLFQRFSQIGAASRRSGSTGLGLAICKGIITAMDGEIEVATTPGLGSTFWFEIPVQVAGAVSGSLLAAS
jgi:PAS domain S-box-containing protein